MNSVQLRLADAISAGKWKSPVEHMEPKAHLWESSGPSGSLGVIKVLAVCSSETYL